MGLEIGSFIDDLVITNPPGTDAKSEGDDHLRLVKKVVKATFPGMAGAAWRVQAKSGAYTVVANDNMTVLNCTVALTLTLTAAATLGNQHIFLAVANGGDVIIDPDAAETINGAATLVVPDGSTAIVVCNGTLFLASVAPAVLTAFALTLLDDTTAAAMQVTLGVPPNARLVSTGVGLSGGGDLSANRTHTLDITGLTSAIVAGGDEVAIQDISAVAKRKVTAQAIADLAAGGPPQATQAAIEAETNENTYIPPDLLKKSPGVAKQWVKFDSAGAVNASYNTTSVTDTAVGNWIVNIATNMSSANYCALVSWRRNASGGSLLRAYAHAQAAGTYGVNMTSGSTLTDPGANDDMHAAAFGDQ